MPMMMPPWERPPGPWSERGRPLGPPAGHPGPWAGHGCDNFGPWGAPPFPDGHPGHWGPRDGGAAEHPGLTDHRPEVPWAPALATAPTGGRLSTVTVRHTVRPAQRTREQDPLEPGLKVRTRPSK